MTPTRMGLDGAGSGSDSFKSAQGSYKDVLGSKKNVTLRFVALSGEEVDPS